MAVFKGNCPHCGTQNVAFTILHETPCDQYVSFWDTFAQCGYCNRGIFATFETYNQRKPSADIQTVRASEHCSAASRHWCPKLHPQKCRPESSSKPWITCPCNWDAAGGMFRKALDTGLKSKFPKMKGTLYARIEEAAKKQDLTPELAKWAHEIRLGGNDAAHEEELFSEKDCERI